MSLSTEVVEYLNGHQLFSRQSLSEVKFENLGDIPGGRVAAPVSCVSLGASRVPMSEE